MSKQMTIINDTRKLENKYNNLKLTKSQLIINLLKETLIKKTNENIELNKKFEELQIAENDSNNKIIEALNSENKRLYEELEQTKKENIKIIEKLNNEISKTKKEVTDLQKNSDNSDYKRKFTEISYENDNLKKIISTLENANIKQEKFFNEKNNLIKIFENLNMKLDDIKNEFISKNMLINEEIKEFKEVLKENKHVSNDVVKDNTIKILKESLKIKDKLINQQKKDKNQPVENVKEEDMKEILENEILYSDVSEVQDNKKEIVKSNLKSTKPTTKKQTNSEPTLENPKSIIKKQTNIKPSDSQKSTTNTRASKKKPNAKEITSLKPSDSQKSTTGTKSNIKKTTGAKEISSLNSKEKDPIKETQSKEKITSKPKNGSPMKTITNKENDFDSIVKNNNKRKTSLLRLGKSNTSFFANLSFADSSPAFKKYKN
ncbi:uncharacterized protein VNE69_06059 [Vairimorpha necatrix]|uniref:Uncharacterized protein n=1 Tax=Vairimorpha necatrix TaxID=6039 RepID=A0AAX4JCN6_9MICR